MSSSHHSVTDSVSMCEFDTGVGIQKEDQDMTAGMDMQPTGRVVYRSGLNHPWH